MQHYFMGFALGTNAMHLSLMEEKKSLESVHMYNDMPSWFVEMFKWVLKPCIYEDLSIFYFSILHIHYGFGYDIWVLFFIFH